MQENSKMGSRKIGERSWKLVKIKNKRGKYGLTQESVAEELNVSRQISQIGKQKIYPDILYVP